MVTDANGNCTDLNGCPITHNDDTKTGCSSTTMSPSSTALTANSKAETVGGATTHYGYDVLGNLKTVIFVNDNIIDYSPTGKTSASARKSTAYW